MRGRRLAGAVVALLVLGLMWWTQNEQAVDPGSTGRDGGVTITDDFPVVHAEDLPDEARDVLGRIDAGGPFKYPDNDGVTFENREGLLPDEPRGYYEEYTVEMHPGNRGPWRIVTGDELDEVYWTEDHYESFSVIEDHGIEELG